MKNKEFYKLLKKNKLNTNSGFTLTELLVGLFMSIFVIGALGFGLMSVLRISQTEGSKTAARNEAGRALDFISDELRRAQAIEVDNSLTYLNTDDDPATTNINESIAPDYNLPTDGTVKLALQIPGVSQRVIYSVAPPATTSPWKGPLVIYRWGPELKADGSYVTDATKAGRVNNPAGWANEALIDKVSNVDQNTACDTDGDGTNETITYKGFYACTVDDGDGQVISAQLYFTGETITVSGTSGYSADTQTVARARIAPNNTSEDFKSYTMSFKSLDPNFACNTNTSEDWKMRTDFGESLDNPSSITQWDHKQNRQPQPIKIAGNTLIVSSVPRGVSTDTKCLSKRTGNGRVGNTDEQNFEGNKTLTENGEWKDQANVVAISHAINFNDPRTFNGDPKSCPAYPCDGSAGGKVYSQKAGEAATLNSSVAMLKHGTVIPSYGGYDVDGIRNYDADGVRILASGDQLSLGEFLFSKGLADKDGTGESATYTVNDKIKSDERIIGFEIGQTENPDTNPGFDLQDNIFIVSSDAFKQKYDTYEDSYIGYTPPATLPSYTPLD